MRLLVACECSGVVREAFRKRGHDAWSCDLLPADDASPHHYQRSLDEPWLKQGAWDLMIAHPPCTHLAVSGAHLFKYKREQQADALEFVRMLMGASEIPRIAIENPVSVISSAIRKPDQIIQPWQFGDDASKKTCLWLKGLPLLKPTKIIEPSAYGCACGVRFDRSLEKYGCPNCHGKHKVRDIWANQTPSGQNKLGPSKVRAKQRSRTYQGIADAMAEQWGIK